MGMGPRVLSPCVYLEGRTTFFTILYGKKSNFSAKQSATRAHKSFWFVLSLSRERFRAAGTQLTTRPRAFRYSLRRSAPPTPATTPQTAETLASSIITGLLY